MQIVRKKNGYSITFELQQSNSKPLDCSNMTFKFLVKRNKTDFDGNAILSGTIINPDTNILHFQFDSEETNQLEGKYIGALKLFRSNKMNEEIWVDEFIVERGVIDE